jgi:hypothetical protein
MMRHLCAVLVVALGTTLAAGPKFSSVWKSSDVSRLNFAGKKVAALVITEDQSLQQSAEEALVRELTSRNVNGIASYRIVPRPEMKTVDKVRGWFERAKVEGAVALRPIGNKTEREYTLVSWASGYYPSFWGYYGYGWSAPYEVPTGRVITTIVVETLIYDVAKDRLIWAGTSETRNPKTLQSFISDLIKEAVDEMKKVKLVG